MALNARGGSGRMDGESETFIVKGLAAIGDYAGEFGDLGEIAQGKNWSWLGDGEVAHTLLGEGFDGSPDGTGRGTPLVPVAQEVRRLSPKECCRLQGFPDDYLDITYRGKPAADGPKYKALGNSMAVPVMRWIGERIQKVDRGA